MEFAGFKFVPTTLIPEGEAVVISDEDLNRVAAIFERRIETAFHEAFGTPIDPRSRHPAESPCDCRMVHICNLVT